MTKMVGNLKRFFGKNLGGYLIMLPSVILFAFFIWVPLLKNLHLSFFDVTNYDTIGDFVAFDNYKTIFANDLFIRSLLNTLQYIGWSLLIGFFVPIFLALLVNEAVHFKGIFRTALNIPNFIPGIAATAIWVYFFRSEQNGVLNSILANLGIDKVNWLYTPNWSAIPLIVLTMTWKGAGATMLIYLAALQTIDSTYYEAARIEGANMWWRLRLVTFPTLFQNMKTLLILQVIAVFQVFYEPLMLTKQNPYSYSLLQILYKTAIEDMKIDEGAAMGVIVSLMLFILTFVYLRIVNRKQKAGA
ncbi:MAG: sugar ABC transporter permease [Bacilli bacterium]|nr:sugar ABC transporter permease [Bacilli bacterium]MBN2696601.1 sugar ABC transporter permease [Bacilli bacterium]